MRTFFTFLSLSIACFLITGCDNDTIKPGTSAVQLQQVAQPSLTGNVEAQEITKLYEAIGTVRPLTESVIEAQISAKVLSVMCVPGTAVKKDQQLILLDDRTLKTRQKQAQEGLSLARTNLNQALKSINEARAALDQASSAYERTQKLFESGIAPSQRLEIDKAVFLQAKARLEKTQQAENAAKASIRNAQEIVKEATIALEYATILSPATGVVVEREIDPGDLAVPGKPLLVLQTSGSLRLEANVREGLIGRVVQGRSYQVKIANLNQFVNATIEEIVPYADPATRTFLIKASLPDLPGIYPGMFGRIQIPVETEKTLLIPRNAVRKVGQLELVRVKNDTAWQQVYIKTGKIFGDKIEVLSGLKENETIGYDAQE